MTSGLAPASSPVPARAGFLPVLGLALLAAVPAAAEVRFDLKPTAEPPRSVSLSGIVGAEAVVAEPSYWVRNPKAVAVCYNPPGRAYRPFFTTPGQGENVVEHVSDTTVWFVFFTADVVGGKPAYLFEGAGCEYNQWRPAQWIAASDFQSCMERP